MTGRPATPAEIREIRALIAESRVVYATPAQIAAAAQIAAMQRTAAAIDDSADLSPDWRDPFAMA